MRFAAASAISSKAASIRGERLDLQQRVDDADRDLAAADECLRCLGQFEDPLARGHTARLCQPSPVAAVSTACAAAFRSAPESLHERGAGATLESLA